MTRSGLLTDDYVIALQDPSVKAWTAAYSLANGHRYWKYTSYPMVGYNDPAYYPDVNWTGTISFDTAKMLSESPNDERYYYFGGVGWTTNLFPERGYLNAFANKYLLGPTVAASAPGFRHLDMRLTARTEDTANISDMHIGVNREDDYSMSPLRSEPLQSIRISHFGPTGVQSFVVGDTLQICNADLQTSFSSSGGYTTDLGQSVISVSAINAHTTIYRNLLITSTGTKGNQFSYNSIELNTNIRFFVGSAPLTIQMITNILLATMGTTTTTEWDELGTFIPNTGWKAFKDGLNDDLDLFANEITGEMDATGMWTVTADQDVAWIISVTGWGEENTHDILIEHGWTSRTRQAWDSDAEANITARVWDGTTTAGNLNFYAAGWPSAFRS